jgi:PTH1 family peptidyl-tRNA hydrolase
MIRLIVGLGNPGKEYELTRHNAGVWFVDGIAKETHTSLRAESKFHGLHGCVKDKNYEYHLLIPTTYMNCSGRAVQAVANFYKIPPENILIAHDDIDLPVGDIRLKFDGGAGGHNGLTDIFQQFNSKKFYRLRIGVGHPGNSAQVANFVLKAPGKSDRLLIDAALAKAYPILPFLLDGQYQKAMQALHTA